MAGVIEMLKQLCMPDAIACVRGRGEHQDLHGIVQFWQQEEGVLIEARVTGLPASQTGFFAFHIHEGKGCEGAGFEESGGHYNPGKTMHPEHAGDLPPLLSAGGKALLVVRTDRFRLRDVVGRTVIIHSGPDDFHSQPAGNPGSKIACGVIRGR